MQTFAATSAIRGRLRSARSGRWSLRREAVICRHSDLMRERLGLTLYAKELTCPMIWRLIPQMT
jgi:hypothetical protein